MLRLTVIVAIGLVIAVSFGGAVEESKSEKFDDQEWVDVDSLNIEEGVDGGVDSQPVSERESNFGVKKAAIRRCSPQSCYFYYKHRDFKWSEAQRRCRSYGATLATINNSYEDNFIAAIIDREGGQVWIGLNDIQRESVWRWDGGEKSVYRNWDNKEPNGGKKENCVEMRGHRKGKWNDESCDKRRGFVCERKRPSRKS